MSAEKFRFDAHLGLILLYGLSGLTSVAYEVLWTRMVSLQFGVSVFAVVITVTAFMAGLGMGSLFALQWLRQAKNSLRILAALEGGIALFALFMPVMLAIFSGWMEHAATHFSLPQWYGLIAAAALILLLLPAFAMGAGFPLILAAMGNRNAPLGRIYGLNTLGAACGALLPLWLLPTLGWNGSIHAVAGGGMLLACGFLLLASRIGKTESATPDAHSQQTSPPAPEKEACTAASNFAIRPSWRSLLTYAGIGAASLVLEIAWTRLFGMVMLRTEYVLAIILAVFLSGIGLGSLLAPRRHREIWLAVLPLVAGGFALLSLWLLPALSAWVERAEFASLFGALVTEGAMLALLTLPVTLALGVWLPLLNGLMNGGGMWLYGMNSLGAAAGALVAGFVLIPLLGSTVSVIVAGFALLTLGLSWAARRAAWLSVPVFLALAWPVAPFPQIGALLPKAQAGSRNLYQYEDAVAMTHVVEQADGQRVLLTDLQRMDASTEPTAVFVQANQARLPLLLHPHPRTVLFLGLGTGISVSGSLPFPGLQRDAVEISQGAINAAANQFAVVNQNAMTQTHVIRDDVRHFLSATNNRYDVIIGDVFHPDLAGLSSLLSVQQFQRARARLNEGGLFVQWLALNQFDPQSLNIILRSFRTVFPDARIFLDGMHLALVGPQEKFPGTSALPGNLQRMTPAGQDAATAGEGGWTWLGRYWGAIPQSSGAVQDEWAPVLEFRLPRVRYNGDMDVSAVLRMLLQSRPDMDAAEQSLGVSANDRINFERAYGATELMARSWLAAMQGDARQATRAMYLAYQANPADRWIAYALADTMFASIGRAQESGLTEEAALRQILRLNPRHVEAVRALWRLERKAGDSAQAESLRRHLLELSPLDREARMAGF